MKTEVWLSFIFGTVFFLISISFSFIAFYLPQQKDPQILGNFLYVMQMTLAMSASGVAAVIPGFLNVELKRRLGPSGSIAIRAGGAIAVFIIVLVVNPRSLTLDQVMQRVSYDEILEKCTSDIPLSATPGEESMAYCRQAANLDPKRWEAYHQIGRIYYWTEDYSQAIENFAQSVTLLVGTPENQIITASQIKAAAVTDFDAMEINLSRSYVGIANKVAKDNADSIRWIDASVEHVRKGLWFHTPKDETADTVYDELIYMLALDHAYRWILSNSTQTDDDFKQSVHEFKEYIGRPKAVRQWAEYHLACIYAKANARSEHGDADDKKLAREFLIASLRDLLGSNSEKGPFQHILMKCLLFFPDFCHAPRGSEPIACREMVELARDDGVRSLALAL